MADEQQEEELISFLATISDTKVYLIWKKLLSNQGESLDLPYGGMDGISDATKYFSYISLRKLDDLLVEEGRPDDLYLEKYGIDRGAILQDRERLLPKYVRVLINKKIAHLTDHGDLEVEDYEVIDAALEEIRPCVQRLEKEVWRVLEGGNAM